MAGLTSERPIISAKKFGELMNAPIPRFLVTDIETGPLPDNELWDYVDRKKIKYPDPPGPFNPAEVKYGNRTSQDSRAKWLAQKQRDHAAAAAAYPVARAEAEKEYFEKFRKEALLKATTSVVLSIGYGILMSDGSISIYLDHSNERTLTEGFWEALTKVLDSGGKVYTWYGNGFDIPHMAQKAWKYDVYMPTILTQYDKIDAFSEDGHERFRMGNRRQYTSLGDAAKFLGVAGKLEGIDGSMYWKLLQSGQDDIAHTYLWHDIDACYRVCAKMGMLDRPFDILRSHATAKGKK